MKNDVDGNQIIGNWYSKDGFMKMNIYKLDNEEFRGKILWVNEEEIEGSAARADHLNPDLTLRERLVIGMDFITGLKFSSRKGEWNGGQIYDPQEGKSYHVKIWSKENIDQLFVRPSIDALSVLGETYTWHRMS